jgi:hypothetical protein
MRVNLTFGFLYIILFCQISQKLYDFHLYWMFLYYTNDDGRTTEKCSVTIIWRIQVVLKVTHKIVLVYAHNGMDRIKLTFIYVFLLHLMMLSLSQTI